MNAPLGDDTRAELTAMTEGAVRKMADEAGRAQRIRRERASTQFGWGLLIFDGLIVGASIVSDLMARRAIAIGPGLLTITILLAFGGGALIQGVRLDKILTAWRKDGGSEP